MTMNLISLHTIMY